MDCIGCNWFRNTWPQFLEVVWMGFDKGLSWEYISYCFEWADPLQVNVIGQLKGRTGLESLESHRLKRPSALDFVKFRQCQAVFQVKDSNSLKGALVKGAVRLTLPGLRVSPNKVPLARSWSGTDSLDLLIRRPLAIAKEFPHHGKTDTCWGWCDCKVFVKSQVKSPTIRRTSVTSPASAYYHQPASSCCRVSFSQAGTMPERLAPCGMDFTMMAKAGAPWTSKRTDVCCNKFSHTGQESHCRTSLSWSKIMLRLTQPEQP